MTLPAFGAWAGPKKPKILLLGEAFGEQEEMTRQPFVGFSGQELWRMLGEAQGKESEAHRRASGMFKYSNAWIKHREEWLGEAGVAFTNVFGLRPADNKIESLCETKKENKHAKPEQQITRGFYLRECYQGELQRLREEITTAHPNLIICLGNTACWAALRATNIGSIRGNVALGVAEAVGVKCLPTYHPAAVLRQWSWRPIVVADLMKGFRQGEFPEIRRPQRQVIINPTLEEIANWHTALTFFQPDFIACDIETQAGQIKCIGFASSRQDSIVIPFMDLKLSGGSYWSRQEEVQAWGLVKDILEYPIPKLFQNGLYDLQYILPMGIKPKLVEHDTMLLHHSLFPEMKKGLGFLGSIYTDEASWKLMRRQKADTEKRDE